jgi:glycolate oxidase iron-sulfur subunit
MDRNSLSISDQINQLAEQCVKCGLCLPHCPTYQATLTENESPRGRIALLQALANQQLAPGPKLLEHIDHCLLCRSCERVCPSGVDYGELFDLGQQLIQQQHRPGPATRLGLAMVQRPALLRFAGRLMVLLQHSGLLQVARSLGIGRVSTLLRRGLTLPRLDMPVRFHSHYPAYANRRGKVALFTGCITSATDSRTLSDTIEVLRRFGYDVTVPPDQQCCGALHAHSGEQDTALSLAARNQAAFAGNYDAVIVTASGCAARLLETEPDTPVMDAVSFLARQPWPDELKLRSSKETVAVHEPCSSRNVLRNSDDCYRLLEQIPGLRVIPLQGNQTCCGAAGSYLLRYPGFADQLRAAKLDSIEQQQPDRVVTTNIGCALHLRSGLIERHNNVIHPLVLFREYLHSKP